MSVSSGLCFFACGSQQSTLLGPTRNILHQTVFSPERFCTKKLLHQRTFAPKALYTTRFFTPKALYTRKPFTPPILLHQKQKPLHHIDMFLHWKYFYTRNKSLLHQKQKPFTPKISYTENTLHQKRCTSDTFCTTWLLRQKPFTPDAFCNRRLLHHQLFFGRMKQKPFTSEALPCKTQ